MAQKYFMLIVVCLVIASVEMTFMCYKNKCKSSCNKCGCHEDDRYYRQDNEDDLETRGERPVPPVSFTPAYKSPLCGDWHSMGSKCYMIIDKLTYKSDAREQCKYLDRSASLVEVRSRQERDEIHQILRLYRLNAVPVHLVTRQMNKTVYSNSSHVANVWLGMRYNDEEERYEWDDGTGLKYNNWDEDSPDTKASNLCVQANIDTGKWSDVKCNKRNLVVCQKKNELTLENLYNTLQSALTNVTSRLAMHDQLIEHVEKLRAENEQLNRNININNVIPIGFIYTQLPNQSSPQQLWPNTNWDQITDQYSGLFFRAEGKASKPFGQIQQQNYPRISQIIADVRDKNTSSKTTKDHILKNITVKEGQWTDLDIDKDHFIVGLSLYQTLSENIPENIAIRVWKRTE